LPFIVLKFIVFVVSVLNVLSVTVANQFTIDKNSRKTRCFFAAFYHLKFGDERDDQNYDEAYVNAVLSFCYEIKKVFESVLLKCL